MTVPAYMKRYFHRLAWFMTAYGFILIALLMLMMSVGDTLPEWIRAVLALATAAPIVGVFWTIFRLLAECDDEYQRMLFIRQILLATASTLIIATVWQFLKTYHVLESAPQWIAAIWLAMLGLAAPIARWRA